MNQIIDVRLQKKIESDALSFIEKLSDKLNQKRFEETDLYQAQRQIEKLKTDNQKSFNPVFDLQEKLFF